MGREETREIVKGPFFLLKKKAFSPIKKQPSYGFLEDGERNDRSAGGRRGLKDRRKLRESTETSGGSGSAPMEAAERGEPFFD